MRSVAVTVITAVTFGVVAAIGTTAVAVAMMPGDSAGEVQSISAIATPSQEASVGAALTGVLGGAPTVATAPQAIALDAETVAKTGTDDSVETTPSNGSDDTSEGPAPTPTAPSATGTGSNSGSSSNSGSGSSNSGNGNSDKAAKDAAKEAEKAAKEAAKEAAKAEKEAQKAADKAAKEQAKADKDKSKDSDESDG